MPSADVSFDGISLATDEVEACVRDLKVPEVISCGANFANSANTVLHLFALPIVLAGMGAMEVLASTTAIMAASAMKKSNPTDDRAEISDLKQKFRESVHGSRANEKMTDLAEMLVAHAVASPKFAPAGQTLLYAGVVFGWTAFECLAGDLWTASVNARPSAVMREILDDTDGPHPDGMTSKSISVGLLARYNFDLRSHMGTILKGKFEFTNVDGIRRAFAALGADPILTKRLVDPDLRNFEAARHLIVHKGAVVDERFRGRVPHGPAVGSILAVDGAELSRLLNAGLFAGCELLRFVDRWLGSRTEDPTTEEDVEV